MLSTGYSREEMFVCVEGGEEFIERRVGLDLVAFGSGSQKHVDYVRSINISVCVAHFIH